MTFPSAPVSILHSKGIVLWPASTSICNKAWVSLSTTLSIYKEWKYSCGVSSVCGISILCTVGQSVLGSVVSMACTTCGLCCLSLVLALGRERQTDLQWPNLPQASHFVPYAGHDLRGGSWKVPQFPHLSPWVPCAGGVFMCCVFRPCCRASTVVIWLPLMSCNWLLVASWVLAMLTALLSVRLASYSRSFDWTRGLFDPKIRASIICSSGFVNLHSFTKIRTFFRNESTDSPASYFRVRSL